MQVTTRGCSAASRRAPARLQAVWQPRSLPPAAWSARASSVEVAASFCSPREGVKRAVLPAATVTRRRSLSPPQSRSTRCGPASAQRGRACSRSAPSSLIDLQAAHTTPRSCQPDSGRRLELLRVRPRASPRRAAPWRDAPAPCRFHRLVCLQRSAQPGFERRRVGGQLVGTREVLRRTRRLSALVGALAVLVGRARGGEVCVVTSPRGSGQGRDGRGERDPAEGVSKRSFPHGYYDIQIRPNPAQRKVLHGAAPTAGK